MQKAQSFHRSPDTSSPILYVLADNEVSSPIEKIISSASKKFSFLQSSSVNGFTVPK